MNRVTLYSNGTGVFERSYTLTNGEPHAVSLPIRNDSLDEAVASISVFGDVALKDPPNYTPIGVNATELRIQPKNVLRSLATTLRGANVTLQIGGQAFQGRMAGLQKYSEARKDEQLLTRYRFVLLDESGALRTFPEEELTSLQFTDAGVQAEIDKELQRAFETIKPNSSFVNLTLIPNTDAETEARVQYAIAQLGAWKISYRLRALEGRWELEGQAVVDNNTDEPWDDFRVSVISGHPISFSTDLAEIRPVLRSRVNVVADEALGSVLMEDAVARNVLLSDIRPAYDMNENLHSPVSIAERGIVSPARKKNGGSSPSVARSMAESASPAALYGARAQQMQAETRQIDEEVEYVSPSTVSIGANKSAIIPLFAQALDEARKVLVYKPERHPDRPFRAVRFKNETPHSLGHGVCTLFEEGAYVGKAILETTPPGDERTLPYALESGVRVFEKALPVESRRVAVRISQGKAIFESETRSETTYTVQNKMTTAHRFEMEYGRRLRNGSTIEVTLTPSAQTSDHAEIPSGLRIGATLPASESLAITVRERLVSSQDIELQGRSGLQWLHTQLGTTAHPLRNDPALQECFRLQDAVYAAIQALNETEQQSTDLLEEQERLKGLLHAGGHEGAANEWRVTLAENERRIKEIKTRQLPERRSAIRDAEAALQEALDTLTADWME